MKQLTFGVPTTCTHVLPDGTEQRVTYGYYEAVMIISENGHDVNRTKILAIPDYEVTEVVRHDGIKIVFDKPLYKIEIKEFGDGSGRIAKSS